MADYDVSRQFTLESFENYHVRGFVLGRDMASQTFLAAVTGKIQFGFHFKVR